jgi:hypothetical protein
MEKILNFCTYPTEILAVKFSNMKCSKKHCKILSCLQKLREIFSQNVTER